LAHSVFIRVRICIVYNNFQRDDRPRRDNNTDIMNSLWGNISVGPAMETAEGQHFELEVGSMDGVVDVNNLLATAKGPIIHLWDASTYAPVGMLNPGNTDEANMCVMRFDFSKDNTRLVAAYYCRQLIVWDLIGGREVARRHEIEIVCVDICFLHHRNDTVLMVETNRRIDIWEVGRDQIKKMNSNATGMSKIRLSHDNLNVAFIAGCVFGLFCVDDTGLVVTRESIAPFSCIEMALCPTELEIAIGCNNGDIIMWDLGMRQGRLKERLFDKAVSAVVYSSDGMRLFGGSSDKTIKIFDKNTHTLQTLVDMNERIYAMFLAPDGSKLTVCSGRSDIHVIDSESGTIVTTLEGQNGDVVAYSKPTSVILM
jgi:WD40 repeat protein